MYRIDAENFVADANGAGKNGFGNGNAVVPIGPTVLDATWLNEIQEEVCNVVAQGGLTLAKGTRTQLRDSVQRMIGFRQGNGPSATLDNFTAVTAYSTGSFTIPAWALVAGARITLDYTIVANTVGGVDFAHEIQFNGGTRWSLATLTQTTGPLDSTASLRAQIVLPPTFTLSSMVIATLGKSFYVSNGYAANWGTSLGTTTGSGGTDWSAGVTLALRTACSSASTANNIELRPSRCTVD